jgi:hypothetical protein
MHLSPHEQQPIVPWLKTFPKKVNDRFTTYLWPLGTVAMVTAIINWSEVEDHKEDYAHRF